jgi:hypothetical protein
MRTTQHRYRKELQFSAVIRMIMKLIADKQEMKRIYFGTSTINDTCILKSWIRAGNKTVICTSALQVS